MAKHDKEHTEHPPVENGEPNPGTSAVPAPQAQTPMPVPAPGATVSGAVSDERYVMVTLDAQYPGRDGVSVKRIDLIRELWAAKHSRGSICKEVGRLVGEKVPYQIVFSATKGLAGGPDKVAAA
jgi:hypothetical protein